MPQDLPPSLIPSMSKFLFVSQACRPDEGVLTMLYLSSKVPSSQGVYPSILIECGVDGMNTNGQDETMDLNRQLFFTSKGSL